MKGSLFQIAEAKTVDMKRDMDNINELERLRQLSSKLSGFKLDSLPEDSVEEKQILTELDKQKIELFGIRQMERNKGDDFLNRSHLDTSEIVSSFKNKSSKKNFFADDDEF